MNRIRAGWSEVALIYQMPRAKLAFLSAVVEDKAEALIAELALHTSTAAPDQGFNLLQ